MPNRLVQTLFAREGAGQPWSEVGGCGIPKTLPRGMPFCFTSCLLKGDELPRQKREASNLETLPRLIVFGRFGAGVSGKSRGKVRLSTGQ